MLLFVLALVPWAALSKSVTGRAQLEAGDFDTGPEHEVTKYSFVVGESRVAGTIRYKDPHTWMTSPTLYMFMDERWDQYHSAPSCMDKIKHAHAHIEIGKTKHTGLGKSGHSDTKLLPDGTVEWSFEWFITHSIRTHGWFVILADCALEQYNTKVSPMEYEIQFFNPGNTHLPADEYGLPRVYLLVFLLLAGFGCYATYLLYRHYEDQGKKIHLVVKLLAAAYALQLTSIFFELLHLWFYKGNGVGLWTADISSELLEGLSQTMISFVLICLASGWTLVDVDEDAARPNSVGTLLRNPSNLFSGANAVVFGVIMLVVLTMVLQILNKGSDGDFKKFHDHESTPGFLLVLIRTLLGASFCYSLHRTISFQSKRGGANLLAFLRRLMLLGSLWFLVFPVLVFISSFVAHYLRHWLITAGVLTLQSICLICLAFQFVSQGSQYFKVSSLQESGVLPGAGGFIKPTKASKD